MTDTYVSPILAAQDKIDNLNDLVASLNTENAGLVRTIESTNITLGHRNEIINNLRTMTEKAESLVTDWVDNGIIDEDDFVAIAAIFGWDTVKEIEVTVTATFKGTITVPRGFNTDYLDEQFNVECNIASPLDGYVDCDEISVEVSN